MGVTNGISGRAGRPWRRAFVICSTKLDRDTSTLRDAAVKGHSIRLSSVTKKCALWRCYRQYRESVVDIDPVGVHTELGEGVECAGLPWASVKQGT